jgi:hypothetical protein
MRLRVCRILGYPHGPTPHQGRYVVAYNPDTPYGTLALTTTADRSQALRAEAIVFLEMWLTVSKVQPKRPTDGRPNRPISGLTMELEDA